jgi:hypothetical protein
MHRHALRDDQWDKIKDFLPGPFSHWRPARLRGPMAQLTTRPNLG